MLLLLPICASVTVAHGAIYFYDFSIQVTSGPLLSQSPLRGNLSYDTSGSGPYSPSNGLRTRFWYDGSMLDQTTGALLADAPSGPLVSFTWFSPFPRFFSLTDSTFNYILGLSGGSGSVTYSQVTPYTSPVHENPRLDPDCSALIRGGTIPHVSTDGRSIAATFIPADGLSLSAAAAHCGFHHFNWVQWVTYDDNPASVGGRTLSAPHLDPPYGGYDYQLSSGGDDYRPGYWNETNSELADHTETFVLRFFDAPTIPPAGKRTEFKTALAGVAADGTTTIVGDWFRWEANDTGLQVLSTPRRQRSEPGVFSVADLSVADIAFLNAQGIAVPDPLDGDADLNGRVDISDLGLLATSWQSAGSWADGDFTHDGFIDITDLGVLATNWQADADAQASFGLPVASIPEPGVVAAASVVLGRHRRRSALANRPVR
jgi:hypothetical protein